MNIRKQNKVSKVYFQKYRRNLFRKIKIKHNKSTLNLKFKILQFQKTQKYYVVLFIALAVGISLSILGLLFGLGGIAVTLIYKRRQRMERFPFALANINYTGEDEEHALLVEKVKVVK